MTAPMSDWKEIKKEGLPNFIIYGFHTGKKLMVRSIDGSETETIYQGYGLFGNGISMFDGYTHWRELL